MNFRREIRVRRGKRLPAFWVGLLLSFCVLAGGAASAAVTVNDAGDTLHNPGCATTGTGDCTLRDAAAFGNAGSGGSIDFNISGCAGVCTITLASPIQITKSTVINGYSQPGSSVNTLAVGDNANLLIEISGGGFQVTGGGSSTFKGLVIGGATTAIFISGGDGNTITGNFIGTDPTGQTAHGNGRGLFINTSNNTIGGTAPADRNILSGSSGAEGVLIGLLAASNNVILGNYIGTNADGTAALGNSLGVSANGTNTTIGGTAAGAGNLISGNQADGIASGGPGTLIQGNLIGTDVTGRLSLFNGTGVVLSGGSTLGGTAATAGNVIATNTLFGVVVTGSGSTLQGNFIGTNASGDLLGNGKFGGFTAVLVNGSNNTIGGTAAGAANVIAHNNGNGVTVSGDTSTGNSIRGNSIFDNNPTPGAPGLGIHLGNGVVVVPNDACDADTGANGLQNHPVITSAAIVGSDLVIAGTLNSTASTTYQIDLYLTECDPSGYGEGQNYLGSTTANTGAGPGCSGTFSATLPIVGSGSSVTATATDPSQNTSEFSPDFPVGQGLPLSYYALTPCRVVDTRNPTGPLGGPALFGNTDRVFALTGHCGVPSDALSVAVNVTVTGSTAAGDLRIYPAGLTPPLVSTINYRLGQTRANNAVAALSCLGSIAVRCDQPPATHVHAIIDVVGYFK